MIHDLNKPWSKDPESRFESPYYEFINVYMMYCACFYVLNFLGYDGFYGLAINHAVLKIQLYSKALEEAMMYSGEEIYQRVIGVIVEQTRTFRYLNTIQDCFNLWLGVIFLATMIQLCNLLYHITSGHGLDIRYFIFISGVTVHIYLPCHYSAKLKFASSKVATQFYCCGWEQVSDPRVRMLLQFMIARAQQPIAIIAVGMITFDMELFVQILQTSYSMYTLLSS
ncbi:hypothetical protein O0L34_g17977 [Tuta absoluta]|nr:hypothetical protein O0L34_g17977 [Tuta absoluta]